VKGIFFCSIHLILISLVFIPKPIHLKLNPKGGGSKFPTDIVCDNGVIHAISSVLFPGFSKVGAEVGLGGVKN